MTESEKRALAVFESELRELTAGQRLLHDRGLTRAADALNQRADEVRSMVRALRNQPRLPTPDVG